jgi:hypothetical protein
MAEVTEKVSEVQDKVQDKLSGASGTTALKAAAAAAATTAATIAVRKALSHDGNGDSEASHGRNGFGQQQPRSSSMLSSAAATSWSAASGVLLPMADDAAEAAGKYVATHGPEILRDRIVPKFIEAFNDAK